MRATIAVPATFLLCYRAYARNSLTTHGIIAAALTATAHAIKDTVKAQLTLSSKGDTGGEGPRTHVQVLANSLVASVLCILHAYQLHVRQQILADPLTPANMKNDVGTMCFSWGGDVAIIGIIANYACVAADTFSSELGILSKSPPRLITSLTLRKVPRGTNGGVTLLGLGAGLMGSMIIVTTAALFIPFCSDSSAGLPGGGSPWSDGQRRTLILGLTLWGAAGSLVDSILGSLLQSSVKDIRSGKIVEGDGGERVLVAPGIKLNDSGAGLKASLQHGEGYDDFQRTGVTDSNGSLNTARRLSFGGNKPSRMIENGWDLLDNNDVNFLMAFSMSMGAMLIAARGT